MSSSTRPPPSAARTLTEEQPQAQPGPSTTEPNQPTSGVLKLRGGPLKQQRVVWSEETVDNEGMGKKKSKICCIYHKPRAFDESSSDDSCSSQDESDTHAGSRDHAQATFGSGHGRRHTDTGEATQEESANSSDSDGGTGDGRARPLRKPRRRVYRNPHSCDQGNAKMNRYDAQPKSEAGAGKGKDKASS